MFLISHETKPMCFLSLGPGPGGSYSCLDMVNSADVNANHARPRAPLRKLVSDTENKFAFFFPFAGTRRSCSEKLSCFHWVLGGQQAEQPQSQALGRLPLFLLYFPLRFSQPDSRSLA